ncbi:MAG: Trm112 family protein [Elusimicrobia bacterium]|nr:Trm112 family protein [Elusimicrobiota bacterium]
MSLDPKLLELLACPACRARLQEDAQGTSLLCPACGARYPVREGIPDFVAEGGC